MADEEQFARDEVTAPAAPNKVFSDNEKSYAKDTHTPLAVHPAGGVFMPLPLEAVDFIKKEINPCPK